MKKLAVICISTAVVFSLSLGIFFSHPIHSSAETLNTTINKLMDEVESGAKNNPETKFSSNPYVFIVGNQYYTEIVNMGLPALPLLEDYINKSANNGLKEYILAAAAEEIAKVNLKTDGSQKYKWTDAKGFVKEWNTHLKNVQQKVDKIVSSNGSKKEKNDNLVKLGIPAIPFIMDYIEKDTQNNSQLLEALQTLLSDNKTAKFESSDVNNPQDWVKQNKDKFKELRNYIDNKKDVKN